jgi:hypothetical protein
MVIIVLMLLMDKLFVHVQIIQQDVIDLVVRKFFLNLILIKYSIFSKEFVIEIQIHVVLDQQLLHVLILINHFHVYVMMDMEILLLQLNLVVWF